MPRHFGLFVGDWTTVGFNRIKRTGACSFYFLDQHDSTKSRKRETRDIFSDKNLPSVEDYINKELKKSFQQIVDEVEWLLDQTLLKISEYAFHTESVNKMRKSGNWNKALPTFNKTAGFCTVDFLDGEIYEATIENGRRKGNGVLSSVARWKAKKLSPYNEERKARLAREVAKNEATERKRKSPPKGPTLWTPGEADTDDD